MSHKDFESGIIHLQNALLRFAQSLTHNDDDAKDLLQETSLKALSDPAKYHDGNLKGWLCTIMRNTFLNDCRHAAHCDNYIADFHIDQKALDDSENAPAFTAGDIARIMQLLSPESQELFTLYLQGYHYDEIATQLNLPIGTVKTRIFRIKRTLQAHRHEIL